MEVIRENYETGLAAHSCANDLFEDIAAIGRTLGFGYCRFAIQSPLPISRPVVLSFGGNQAQPERTEAFKPITTDPLVRESLRANRALYLKSQPNALRSSLWRDAQTGKPRIIWAKAMLDSCGAVAILIVACEREHAELSGQQPQLDSLADTACAHMSRLLMPVLAPESGITLTPREKDVLLWAAEGKTAAETAMIIGVSVNTVQFHFKNAVAKLGGGNKVQTVVKAAVLGMLQ